MAVIYILLKRLTLLSNIMVKIEAFPIPVKFLLKKK